MPQVLRQLLRAGNRADVRLDSVTPQPATARAGYETVPMDVVVTGRYFPIKRFLHRLRTQTRVLGDKREVLRPALQRRHGEPGCR